MSNHENDSLDAPYDFATVNQDHHLDMGEAWLRLQRNGDFKKIIMEGYLTQKTLASTSLLAVPQERNRRVEIMEDLIAGSNLQFYFKMIENFYEGAKDPILSDDEEEAAALVEADIASGMQ